MNKKNKFAFSCAFAIFCSFPNEVFGAPKKVVVDNDDDDDEDDEKEDKRNKKFDKSAKYAAPLSNKRKEYDEGAQDGNKDVKHDQDTQREDYKLDIYSINKTYILNSLRAWLEMHLEEAHNVSFLSEGCEITRHIINGVEAGLLKPYADDECKRPMSKEDFLKNLRDPSSLLAIDGEEVSSKNHDAVPDVSDRFLPRDVSKIRLMVDFAIDSLRSVTHTRIMSICIVIPSKKFATGLEKVVGHFDYRELMNYFDTISPDNSWIDPINSSNNKRFSEVFSMRHYWFPQSYLIYTSEDKVKKIDPQNLDIKKITLLDGSDYLLYFE